MMWGYGYGNGNWLGMGVFMIILLVLIGGAVWVVIARLHTPQVSHLPLGQSASEILRQRYARGDIDQATYTQMQEHLRDPNQAPRP